MATPPAAGFDIGAAWQQLGRAIQSNIYEQIQGRPAPWTESGRRYDQLRDLQGAAIGKQRDDLLRPAPTARQRASDYLTEGTALQSLSNSAADSDVARRLGYAQGMAGIKGTLQNQETQAIGERTRIGTDALADRTNVLTQAELQKLDAATRSKQALIGGMRQHELAVQGNQLDFARDLANSAFGSTERINQMIVQDREKDRELNPANVVDMLGRIAAIGAALFI